MAVFVDFFVVAARPVSAAKVFEAAPVVAGGFVAARFVAGSVLLAAAVVLVAVQLRQACLRFAAGWGFAPVFAVLPAEAGSFAGLADLTGSAGRLLVAEADCFLLAPTCRRLYYPCPVLYLYGAGCFFQGFED